MTVIEEEMLQYGFLYQSLQCFPGVVFTAGINRCGSFPLLSATPLSLSLSSASEQTLKDLKIDPRGTNVDVRRVDLGNRVLRTSPKFTTGIKYQLHQGF